MRLRFSNKRAVALVAAVVIAAQSGAALWQGSAQAASTSTSYVVVLRDGVSMQMHLKQQKITANRLYQSAVNGFVARLNETQYRRELASGDVIAITPDAVFVGGAPWTIAPPPAVQPQQATGNGVKRVGTLSSPTARIDGIDEPMDVDIAILDTGMDLDHPDLDVRGGVNCTNATSYADDNGHGTMVGGFAAEIDNAIGRVGVAPGARLWAVKVVTKNGHVSWSDLLCGLDWVTAHADMIEVANMSLGGGTQLDPANCGFAAKKNEADVVHQAVCAAVEAGVTLVASAGNASTDVDPPGSKLLAPAGYDEVITVSAIADNDGQPGGLGPAFNCLPGESDDTMASFSNFGAPVDLAAPGVCNNSALPDDNYGTSSGTSFAAPIVAGAAALYIASHPGATPAQVRAALLAGAEPGPIPGDRDTFAEGIVNVSGL